MLETCVSSPLAGETASANCGSQKYPAARGNASSSHSLGVWERLSRRSSGASKWNNRLGSDFVAGYAAGLKGPDVFVVAPLPFLRIRKPSRQFSHDPLLVAAPLLKSHCGHQAAPIHLFATCKNVLVWCEGLQPMKNSAR